MEVSEENLPFLLVPNEDQTLTIESFETPKRARLVFSINPQENTFSPRLLDIFMTKNTNHGYNKTSTSGFGNQGEQND